MATGIEWQAVTTALGPLLDHSSLEAYIDKGERWITFKGIYDDDHFRQFSPTEQQVIYLAEVLYNGYGGRFNLAALLEGADVDTWTRCVEAIVTRRGIDKPLDAGQWVESIPVQS